MTIDIITIFPEIFDNVFNTSILGRAKKNNLVTINIYNLRDYSNDKHKKVDDYPFGGEAGMVMGIEPIANCIESLEKVKIFDEKIFLTPDGIPLNQSMCNQFSLQKNLLLLCGHYKGIDERIREHFITKEISIGDYVLTGGEIGAMVLTDAIVRLIPNVISDETSALTDSFQNNLLSHPVYTRPANFRGWEVPKILRSGNFKKIETWREEMALERTKQRRPDILN